MRGGCRLSVEAREEREAGSGTEGTRQREKQGRVKRERGERGRGEGREKGGGREGEI